VPMRGLSSPQRWSATARQHTARRAPHAAHARARIVAEQEQGAKLVPSEQAHEEVLLFVFRQDLDARLTRAETQEQTELAQMIREKIASVDQAEEGRRAASAGPATPSQLQDALEEMDAQVARLEADMAGAAAEERYDDAANLRDELSQLKLAKVTKQAAQLAQTEADYEFRLGQRVVHTASGGKGIVCGFSRLCGEAEEWIASAGIDSLANGRQQPFYHVLVEPSDLYGDPPIVAAAAQEQLEAFAAEDASQVPHAYSFHLFLGQDARGDYIPTKRLREKFDVERWDVYPPSPNADASDESEGEAGVAEGGEGAGAASEDDDKPEPDQKS